MKRHTGLILWTSAGIACTLLTIAGMVDHALRFPGILPRPITRFLAWFIEPGTTVGWLALGHIFGGFPNDWPGYTLSVIANVALWMLAGGMLWAVARVIGAFWQALKRR